MRKPTLFFACILYCTLLVSKETNLCVLNGPDNPKNKQFSFSSSIDKGYRDSPFCFSLLYGSKFLQNNYFNRQFNSLSHIKLNGPLNMVGFCFGFNRYHGLANRRHYQACISYSQFLPASIKVDATTQADVSGFQVGASLLGMDFYSKKQTWLRLELTLGFNTGLLTLNSPDVLKQKNAFFSPKITLRPSVKISVFSLSLIVEYEYDVSKYAWKPYKDGPSGQALLPAFSQSGLSAFFSLGFVPRKKYPNKKA